jgi:hypothetical protein
MYSLLLLGSYEERDECEPQSNESLQAAACHPFSSPMYNMMRLEVESTGAQKLITSRSSLFTSSKAG